MRLLREFRPHVVVGVGGYASGPAMMAALLLRIPTLAYEPNAVPGLTNRLVGKRVTAAAVNFAQTARYFRNAEVTGIPVRPEIFDMPPKAGRRAAAAARFGGQPGSAGVQRDDAEASQLSCSRQIPALHDRASGRRAAAGSDAAAQAYARAGPIRRVGRQAYLDDMAAQYAAADLVLCRSGASTVAELARQASCRCWCRLRRPRTITSARTPRCSWPQARP